MYKHFVFSFSLIEYLLLDKKKCCFFSAAYFSVIFFSSKKIFYQKKRLINLNLEKFKLKFKPINKTFKKNIY